MIDFALQNSIKLNEEMQYEETDVRARSHLNDRHTAAARESQAAGAREGGSALESISRRSPKGSAAAAASGGPFFDGDRKPALPQEFTSSLGGG